MEPLFSPGDTIDISLGWYVCHLPERDDFVMLHFSGNDAPILKRVRGIPGDSFGVDILSNGEGEFLINHAVLKNSQGEAYHISSARAKIWTSYKEQFRGMIPQGLFFVLGEVSAGSLDSSRFGFVRQSDFLGKVHVK
ncbi:MAG: signal peptidase I [Candidatus Moraniibacteriota bacterium]|nr:MAG: signal peptidase I [Candidatus Moranbacteria bacterium]